MSEAGRAPAVSRDSALTPGWLSPFVLTWGAAYLGALLLLLWSRGLHPAYLLSSAVAAVTALLLAWRARARRRDRGALPMMAALLTLLLSLAAAVATTYQLGRVASEWDTLVAARQGRLARALERRMNALVAQGRGAARLAAEAAAAPGDRGLFADLAGIRSTTGVSAVAVFNDAGDLVAWAGDHRGRIPDSVRVEQARIFYAERPLFSYLYFVEPVSGTGDHAVSAVLMQTGLPAGVAQVPAVASRFAAENGARPVFAPGPGGSDSWSLQEGGRAVMHATIERITQADWRAQAAGQGRRLVLLVAGLTILLLLAAWLGAGARAAGTGAGTAVPLVAVALALGVAPVGSTLGAKALSSPAYFLLPGPGELSLGMLIAVLLPLGALAATLRPLELSRRTLWLAILAGAVLVGAGFLAGLRLLLDASATPLLQSGGSLWLALQPAAVLLLAMVAGVALSGVGTKPDRGQSESARVLPLVAGIGLAAVLSVLVLSRWRAAQRIEAWPAALWGFAFVLVAIGVARYHGRGSRLARWILAGWLAASAVLPYLWVVHVQARLESSDRQVATLGTRPDPFLDYLLRHFAVEAMRRQELGESGVELVYRTWVASGFAREAYPARITLWDPSGKPLVALGLGGAGGSAHPDSLPPFLRSLLSDARTTGVPVVEAMHDVPNVNQAMAVRLRGGEELSLVVPPRRSFQRATSLAPFLGASETPETRLDLVPVKPGVPPPPRQIVWHATSDGWRSEVLVHFPEGDYHAHVQVMLPSVWVRFARGVLLVALDLGLLALLWGIGRAARGDVPRPPGGWRALLRGFRARLTLTLFAFFLLPTVVFGYVAYRALAGEVLRSARIVAEHAVAQASRDFPTDNGDLRILSQDAGEEMLYYQRGELLSASSTEAYELGLYSTWMPPSVYSTLQSGEEVAAVEPQRLADHPYLVAYQRLPVVGTLAVPVPLAAGDTAIRQQELAHLILFAALIGALLTLGLSVTVGRALAGPISQLRRAAALVGGGQLRVRLPEARGDEFGDLFASFNRMARRLRRARAQELQAARVLAWGEMARQVAHEIKNPLTPIKLSVQHLRRAYGDRRHDFGPILETSVDQILAEIDRLSEIARAFSRYGAPAGATGPLEPVDVGSVVHDALTLYSASEARIRYEEDIEPGLPRIRARTGELKEVILNLVENARAALDGNGRITVSARLQPERAAVVIEVSDDGPGIPPVLLPRIFEPHFSTHSAGTGLGLAIVRRLVEGWDATIVVDSEPGEGTAVRIRVPLADEQATPS